eukprot:scaffold847_cov385-Prasinococcus_capsulatus_cf.AAC.5
MECWRISSSSKKAKPVKTWRRLGQSEKGPANPSHRAESAIIMIMVASSRATAIHSSPDGVPRVELGSRYTRNNMPNVVIFSAHCQNW